MDNLIVCQIKGQNIYLLYKLPLRIKQLFFFFQCSQKLHANGTDALYFFIMRIKMNSAYQRCLLLVTHGTFQTKLFHGGHHVPPGK